MNTEIITITDPASQQSDIEKAASYLKAGEVVAIPTETVYGLAADTFRVDAVKKIFEAKGRPQDNPLIVHIADIGQLYEIAAQVPEVALKLAEKYWPGPLTVILPKKDIIPDEVSAGLETVAVRMPSHPIANAVIKAAGVPLAAPSANISGFPSPTAFQYVFDDMSGRIPAIIDGGDCDFGIESTVVTLATPVPRLLRPGAVTHEQLTAVLGQVDIDDAVLNPLKKGSVAASPGMKYKHYAPKAELSLVLGDFETFKTYVNAHKTEADYLLCFEGEEKDLPLPAVTMGTENDSLSQAKRLFDALRELDEKKADKVFVRAPSQKGVGLGVCNRLYRACAFRFLKDEKKGKIIGIAGGTGSGKSTVCRLLEEKGAWIIDADKIARRITEKGSEVLDKLADTFGRDILYDDGTLNRKKLADIAFSSPRNTAKLNAVTGAYIVKTMKEEAFLKAGEGKTVILDAPLLFTSGLNFICDFTVKVEAPEEVRIKRILQRDTITEEEAVKRLNAQKTEEKLSQKADKIIRNYEPFVLKEEVKAIFGEILLSP